jgi:hypothetical protein
MSATDEVAQLAARVRALEDRARLEALISDYASGLDTADRGSLESILAPDLRARHGAVFEPLDGRDAFLAQVEHLAPRWLIVQHHVSNVSVDLDEARRVSLQAGDRVHAIMLPKVRTPGDVEMTDKLLTQIELVTGFADQAHLTRWFRRVVGVTPGAYRRGVHGSVRPAGPVRSAGRNTVQDGAAAGPAG